MTSSTHLLRGYSRLKGEESGERFDFFFRGRFVASPDTRFSSLVLHNHTCGNPREPSRIIRGVNKIPNS